MVRIIANAAEPHAPGPPANGQPSMQPVRSTPSKKELALQLDVASLDALDDAALALDESGNITYCNPAAEALYRTSGAAIVGRPFQDLVDDPRRRVDADETLRALKANELFHTSGVRGMHVTSGGRPIPVHVTLIPFGAIGGPRRHNPIVRGDRTGRAPAARLGGGRAVERVR